MEKAIDTHGRAGPRGPGILTLARTELTRMFLGNLVWFALLAPPVLALPMTAWLVTDPGAYVPVRESMVDLWTVYLPLHGTILAALSVSQDDGAMRYLLGYPIPRAGMFVGKFTGLAVLLALSQTMLLAVLLAMNAVVGDDSVTRLTAYAYLPLVAALAVLALGQVVASAFGLGPAIAVGAVGLLSGGLLGDKDAAWWYSPFAWPIRSALLVEQGAADAAALTPLLGLSGGLLAATVLIGCWVMRHKQV